MGYGSGETDLFMEITRSDGSQLEGESQDNTYAKHIELESFSFGGPSFEEGKKTRKPGSDQQKAVRDFMRDMRKKKAKGDDDDDDVSLRDTFETYSFVVRKEFDSSSPELLISYCNNLTAIDDADTDVFQLVTIRFRVETASQEDVVILQMEFGNAFVVEYEMEIDEDTSLPRETVKFKFDQVQMIYTPQTATGEAAEPLPGAGWDFQAKVPWSG